MLSIGDGANDVAMLQTADVGIGIMGKEGRQAVNNSDYAISQFRWGWQKPPGRSVAEGAGIGAHGRPCAPPLHRRHTCCCISRRRFLVPLLLVHGNLSYYRLARLIKYSFYKNITFAFVLFYYQFYAGFSGQALVDSITAAVFNVVFTSLPILLFAILDRPVKNLKALVRYPQARAAAACTDCLARGQAFCPSSVVPTLARARTFHATNPHSPPLCSCTTSVDLTP